MPTFSKAIRADDVSGLNIATATITEAAETRHIQRVVWTDGDDGTAADVAGESTFEKGLVIYGHDGTVPRAITTDTAGDPQVDIVTMPNVTLAAGTNTNEIVGDVAHDAVNAGNPVQVGREAIAHGTNPTAVAAGDATKLYANRAGIPFVLGGHPNIITLEAAYTAAQTDAAIVTIGAGLKIVVTQTQMTADNANTVDVGFRVGFGAVNTPTTTGVVLTHPGVAAGSGISRGDGSGIIGVGADGEDLRITSEVPTTGSIRILVSYFTIES